MKNKALRVCVVLILVVFVFSFVAFAVGAADSGANSTEAQTHSDYVPTNMYSDDFSKTAWAALGGNTSQKSELITYGGNFYTLLRPNVTAEKVAETRYDIGLSSRKQGDVKLINLKSFTNDKGSELTYTCTTKYVVYEFDIGTETDLTDGLEFQIISRKVKSSTSTALSDQSIAGTISLYIADDEVTGNLLLGRANGSYIDTGVSVDNEFAHISVVLDLTEVISSSDPSKATAYVYVNGGHTNLSLTGFSSSANYFDMARLVMNGVPSKSTDSLAVDNYASRSFGEDYNGNLASILSDTSKELTEFDCGLYNESYRLPSIRPLAKVKDEAINTNKELRAAVSSGEYVRFMRTAGYYLPTGIDGVTEYAPAADTLYATFDADGKLIASYTSVGDYNKNLTGPAFAEIYSDITVAAVSEITPASSIIISLNGNTITYDAANSTSHFIVGKNNKTITYRGPGVIKAAACYQAGTTTPRNLIYIHQATASAVVNIEDITFDTYGEAMVLRSGTTNFKNCDMSWSRVGSSSSFSTFITLLGTVDGSETDTSPRLNIDNCNVSYTGTDNWANYFLHADTALVTGGTQYLKTNKSVITITSSTVNIPGVNFIRTARSYSPADNPAIVEPTLNLLNTSVTALRRFAPVDGGSVPTFNIIGSKIVNPSTDQFIQNGAVGEAPVINIESTLLGTNPTNITGKVTYLNGNKLSSTTDTKYPYLIIKPDVKANMSLNSDFNFNFYVPRDAFVSALANGEALTLGNEIVIGSKTYVQVIYEGIAPARAGASVVVSITMKHDGYSYTAKYSASVPEYVKQVNAKAEAGYEDSKRALPLMASIVNYIDSSYTYFGSSDGIDSINALKALLSSEIAKLEGVPAGTPVNTMANVNFAVAGAQMALESVPKVRFNLAAGYSGTVTINGQDYTVSDGMFENESYIEVNMRARNLSNVITVKVGDAIGQYNIAAYYNYLEKQNESEAVALLDALYIYGSKSGGYAAHVYDEKTYVSDENYHWHICTDTSCNTASIKVAHSFDDSGECECGYVYGDTEQTGNFLNGLGITEVSKTELEDMKFAKVLNNSSATYTFTDEEKALVNSGDVLLFSFVVKAKDASVPLDIKVDVGTVINKNKNEDSKTMTYYVPVQWTRIYMPIENNGMGSVSLETNGTVYIAEAKFENYGSINIETLNLKSGMWMIDEFEKIELSGSETYLNPENKTGAVSAIKLSRDGKYLFSIGYANTGTFSITDTANGEVIGQLTGLGSELRQLAITEDDNYAMITSRASGACIINMTDKAAPQLVSSYNTVELATGLYINGNYAFVTNRYHGVEVVDISVPEKPVQKANIYTGGEVQSCVVYKNILYCGVWGECGVYMYDLTELERTSELTMIGKVICNGKGDGLTVTEIGGRTYIFAATGQHTYNALTSDPFQNLAYGQGNGLDIFDVTDPSSPIHISTSKIDGRYYYTANDFWEADVSYDEENGKYYAYLVNTYNGIYVYDVTDLAAPVRLAHITLPLYNGTVLTHSSRTIITSWNQAIEARSAVGSIAVKEGVIYLAGTSSSVHKYENKSLFYTPHESENGETNDLVIGDVYSNLDTGLDSGAYTFWSKNNGQVLSVSTYGEYIYVAAGSDGILVFKKGNFSSDASAVYTYAPKTVNGRVGFASSIEIKNGRLYCAEDVAGLGVYTINSDGSLTEIEKLRYQNTSYVISQVRISPNGSYAVLQINSDKIGVISIDETSFTNTSDRYLKTQSLSGGNMYHRNLSEIIQDRYIIAWNHVGLTCWIDFAPEGGVDKAPNIITVQCDTMKTMVSGIASYNGAALCITGGSSYRLFTDTTTFTGVSIGSSVAGKPTVCGDYLVVTRHDSGMIYIVNLKTSKVVHTIDTVGNPDIAYYDADTKTVYIPLGNQGLLTIDLTAAFGVSAEA